MSFRPALLASTLLLATASAQAGVLTTSFAAFTAAAGNHLIIDGNSSIADGLTISTLPLAAGGAARFSPGVTKDNLTNDAALVPYANGYAGDVYTTTGTSLTITLPANSFGFTITTASTGGLGGSSSYRTTVSSSDGQSVSAQAPAFNPLTDTGLASVFFGFIGNDALTLTIISTDPNGFTIGEIVETPEPASLALLATAASALLATRRKRG